MVNRIPYKGHWTLKFRHQGSAQIAPKRNQLRWNGKFLCHLLCVEKFQTGGAYEGITSSESISVLYSGLIL